VSDTLEQNIAPSKLPSGGDILVGRESELALLDESLASGSIHVISLVAWGGVGKSALAAEWMGRLAARDWPGIERYFDWSFYSQGTKDQSAVSADVFIAEALKFFGDPDPTVGSPHDRGDRLAQLVARRPTLLILDGVEPLQYGPGPLHGQLKDPAVRSLLRGLALRPFTGLCIATTRETLTDLNQFHAKTVISHPLEHLTDLAGAELLFRSGASQSGGAGIQQDDAELQAASRAVGGHALTLSLLGGYLGLARDGDIRCWQEINFQAADTEVQGGHAFRMIETYEHWLSARIPPGPLPQRLEEITQAPGEG